MSSEKLETYQTLSDIVPLLSQYNPGNLKAILSYLLSLYLIDQRAEWTDSTDIILINTIVFEVLHFLPCDEGVELDIPEEEDRFSKIFLTLLGRSDAYFHDEEYIFEPDPDEPEPEIPDPEIDPDDKVLYDICLFIYRFSKAPDTYQLSEKLINDLSMAVRYLANLSGPVLRGRLCYLAKPVTEVCYVMSMLKEEEHVEVDDSWLLDILKTRKGMKAADNSIDTTNTIREELILCRFVACEDYVTGAMQKCDDELETRVLSVDLEAVNEIGLNAGTNLATIFNEKPPSSLFYRIDFYYLIGLKMQSRYGIKWFHKFVRCGINRMKTFPPFEFIRERDKVDLDDEMDDDAGMELFSDDRLRYFDYPFILDYFLEPIVLVKGNEFVFYRARDCIEAVAIWFDILKNKFDNVLPDGNTFTGL